MRNNLQNNSFTLLPPHIRPRLLPQKTEIIPMPAGENKLPEILFITSYPPRECGIATYSQDLIRALNNKFSESFSLKVCALESGKSIHDYPEEVKYVLNTRQASKYSELAGTINKDKNISMVVVQHEFGLHENTFYDFLKALIKPYILVFHTVLPNPDKELKTKVGDMTGDCERIIVMTQHSAGILEKDYGVSEKKIEIIAHGTHLVPYLDKETLKKNYGLNGRKVLSTFGLLSSGKGIETTLDALPEIIRENPEVIFLILGKTHPGVIRSEGETYRNMLLEKVNGLKLSKHVRFVNHYLPLNILLEYLQLTDIYLFTSTDPNQAVSGTFSYAMSCACPIISTPFPHAREVLKEDTGIIIDFHNPKQLAGSVNRLLGDESLRMSYCAGALKNIIPTAWENSAIAHARLFQKINRNKINLKYSLPEVSLEHLKKMTTDHGILQFSKINDPDKGSGYTLDDNARALIAVCMHYELTNDKEDLKLISLYLNFIKQCQQPEGNFLNYVDYDHRFTSQNDSVNQADANGRAIWALGYLISFGGKLPEEFIRSAEEMIERTLHLISGIYSSRAMAFSIKGLYYYQLKNKSEHNLLLIGQLANRLVEMYRHESEKDWNWFESYLTYANSILPEAILFAWLAVGDPVYKAIAKDSFDFLLSKIFNENFIRVIPNRIWLHKGRSADHESSSSTDKGGQQPIDVAYTVLALDTFSEVFAESDYDTMLETSFNWFLGKNDLSQVIYNPRTGGCFDGLEEHNVNLNQGAESTISYLLARLTVEKRAEDKIKYRVNKKDTLQNLRISQRVSHMNNEASAQHS